MLVEKICGMLNLVDLPPRRRICDFPALAPRSLNRSSPPFIRDLLTDCSPRSTQWSLLVSGCMPALVEAILTPEQAKSAQQIPGPLRNQSTPTAYVQSSGPIWCLIFDRLVQVWYLNFQVWDYSSENDQIWADSERESPSSSISFLRFICHSFANTTAQPGIGDSPPGPGR